MADFHQSGIIATLHRLNRDGRMRLEAELERLANRVSIGLVLPALYSEFRAPAMRRIVNELSHVQYLKHVVVALGRASRDEYLHAKSFFDGLPSSVTILWIDSPPVQELFQLLEQNGISAGEDGKGRSCWLSYGYLLASGDCDVMAVHDCDIKNYDRELLARLCYPVAHPDLNFEFCKGYYARVTNSMHGRVTRLFLTPLIRAMESLAPGAGFLRFLDSFRYPLAGEFAMQADLARINRIPGDWGLEVGVLAEIYRNCSPSRTCQVDLADDYDHKHQDLSINNCSGGLSRMACDVARALYRTMACEGVVFSPDHFRTLEVRYIRVAQDLIESYCADAALNGLDFNRHAEELAVSVFAASLRRAAHHFIEDPVGTPLLPNWNRVLTAIPEFFQLLLEAVEVSDERTAACVA
ncbi:MAG TPA: hypothetical protein VJN43_06485 [Bryobacteraceae bacterium]|nr:hypothetical protein [Bryobacteraceae bacterium]